MVDLAGTANASAMASTGQSFDLPAAPQPPFGTYAPTALQSMLVALAQNTLLGRGQIRWMISRMIAGLRPGPIDVTRLGFKQRLHHYGKHFVEKKMLLHIHDYDRRELAHLRTAIFPGFHFVDIGANVGLYVFAVKSWDPDSKILAIEANSIYADRLRFNVAVNDLENVSVVTAAAGPGRGTGTYYLNGESMLGSGPSIEVPVRSLHDMLVEAGFDHVDAIKIDIEGFEGSVLPSFFDTAPRSLWPRLMIVEVWNNAVTELCLARGYRIILREPGCNTIFELTDA